jgi:hypothetical protein
VESSHSSNVGPARVACGPGSKAPDSKRTPGRHHEARKLNNPPTSLLDYNDAKRGLETQPSAAQANNARSPSAIDP